MAYEEFEKKLMGMLLAGNDDVLIRLREQYRSFKIKSREHSDVGFFTTFSQQNRNDLCIDGKSFQIGDVDGSVNGIDGAVGFILYVKNGFISMLEGYTNIIDKWPEIDDKIVLTYDSGTERDIERIRKKWA